MRPRRDDVLANLDQVRSGIERAAERSGRPLGDVRLVAATKTVPADAIGWVVDAGVADVGENYVRELRDKVPRFPSVRWHFIGTLQSGSVRHVAALVDVVETLSGGRAPARLARRASEAGRRLDALIEVDFTGARTGVAPDGVPSFADEVAAMEGLRLIGLMTLPPMPASPGDSRDWFVRLRGLRDRVREKHPDVLELSMGMSLDYEVAVEEGATMVRVGTALFGPRS
jgi:PLP dependent protein